MGDVMRDDIECGQPVDPCHTTVTHTTSDNHGEENPPPCHSQDPALPFHVISKISKYLSNPGAKDLHQYLRLNPSAATKNNTKFGDREVQKMPSGSFQKKKMSA